MDFLISEPEALGFSIRHRLGDALWEADSVHEQFLEAWARSDT